MTVLSQSVEESRLMRVERWTQLVTTGGFLLIFAFLLIAVVWGIDPRFPMESFEIAWSKCVLLYALAYSLCYLWKRRAIHETMAIGPSDDVLYIDMRAKADLPDSGKFSLPIGSPFTSVILTLTRNRLWTMTAPGSGVLLSDAVDVLIDLRDIRETKIHAGKDNLSEVLVLFRTAKGPQTLALRSADGKAFIQALERARHSQIAQSEYGA